ncbi:MAG: hypothetical protein JSV65_10940, partial [Armatimonadota bacterium]
WEHDHWIHMTALRRGRFKLIMENDVPRYFFDLGDDPKEERNLLGKGVPEERELVAEPKGTLGSLRAEGQALRRGERAPTELPEEVRKTLKGFGYMQ